MAKLADLLQSADEEDQALAQKMLEQKAYELSQPMTGGAEPIPMGGNAFEQAAWRTQMYGPGDTANVPRGTGSFQNTTQPALAPAAATQEAPAAFRQPIPTNEAQSGVIGAPAAPAPAQAERIAVGSPQPAAAGGVRVLDSMQQKDGSVFQLVEVETPRGLVRETRTVWPEGRGEFAAADLKYQVGKSEIAKNMAMANDMSHKQTPLVAVIGPDGKQVMVTREQAIGKQPAGAPSAKPLPPAALNLQQQALDAIGTSASIGADIASVKKQIEDGKLDLGLLSNPMARARNALGMSTPESRNLASFEATLEKMRNDSLRLNKGVQTEGDAQRAWNELVKNINDPGVVKQRLSEIEEINKRAVNLHKMSIDTIRQNYGHEPLDTTSYEQQPAAVGANKGAPAARAAGPKMGDVKGGFVYIGGDPAQQTSWRKL